jgi:hypothetical protein
MGECAYSGRQRSNVSRKNRNIALQIDSQPFIDELFKKREKKMEKIKTANPGDISLDK